MRTKILILLILIGLSVFYFQNKPIKQSSTTSLTLTPTTAPKDPLSIESMRSRTYPGSDIVIEETLPQTATYNQYITSYKSDGLKIYALLTVPLGSKPSSGWPIIVFNHGYIPPTQYQTNVRYESYVDAFARNGYVVFKPDYRGNGTSEGSPEGAYYSPAYAIDDLNAITSIKKYKDVNPHKVGVWGHSMGGNITLRDLVVRPNDIQAAVIWGGVVGSYSDLLTWRDPKYQPPPQELALRNRHRAELIQKYGTPDKNPTYWNSIDPTYFIKDIVAPVQLHSGEGDEEVPYKFSQSLHNKLQKAGKTSEVYIYPGANHNISQSFNVAMERSVAFFNKYLKSE